MRKDFHSDGIKIDTGHNSAGNGGDGYNTGNVITTQFINANPYNNANVDIGGQDHHKVAWDAPVAPHPDGGVTTNANQYNFVLADQSQTVLAGVGGNGGDNNHAVGGIEVDSPHLL